MKKTVPHQVWLCVLVVLLLAMVVLAAFVGPAMGWWQLRGFEGDAPSAAPAQEVAPPELKFAPTTDAPAFAGEAEGAADAPMLPENVQLQLPPVLQLPELPNGCEATSLTMALAYLGYPAEKMAMAYEYLPREDIVYVDVYTLTGPDPNLYYAGDPGVTEALGFYCFPAALCRGANAYLYEFGAQHIAKDLTGTPAEELPALLEAGTPVIVWATVDGLAPRYSEEVAWVLPGGNERHTPYSNLHVMVLTGYNDQYFFLNDPLQGLIQIERGRFALRYEQMGARAVGIFPFDGALIGAQ